jgi:hypothetical protein
MVTAMAIVIEFVPEKFRKQRGKCVPPDQRGYDHSLSRAGEEVGMT